MHISYIIFIQNRDVTTMEEMQDPRCFHVLKLFLQWIQLLIYLQIFIRCHWSTASCLYCFVKIALSQYCCLRKTHTNFIFYSFFFFFSQA